MQLQLQAIPQKTLGEMTLAIAVLERSSKSAMGDNYEKKTEKALRWILDILAKHKSSYLITGGFAAKLYGATRELADIDLEIPHEKFDGVIKEVKLYIFLGPERYQDKNWDLVLAKLEYKGQKMDICDGDSLKIIDDKTKKVVLDGIDFSKPVQKEVFGMNVDVIPKEILIRYKSALRRDVDKMDIEQMQKN